MNFSSHQITLSVLFAAGLLTVAPMQAQTQIGYTTGNMGRSTVFHYGSNQSQGMAIRLSHAKLQALAGHSITAINTAFGSANGVRNKLATVFVATSMTDDPVLEQNYTIAAANRWTEIQLDTPYAITGEEEELLVGYTLFANNNNIPEALQADRTEGNRGCSYAWDGSNWIDLYGTGFGSPNLRLVLDSELNLTDAMLSEIDFSQSYYLAGTEYEHNTHVFNFGTQPISRIDVSVQIGDDTQTLTYDGLNIAQFETFDFALPKLSSDVTGSTAIEVNVSVNGQEDACIEDNAFGSSAYFYPANFERNFLVEEFTGVMCPNCPAGARTLHSAIEQSGQPCIQIMHHSGYSADIYSSDADWDYTMYYGSPNIYAPAAMINRVTNPAVSDVPVMNAQMLNSLLNTFDYAARLQPYVSMGIESKYNAESREVEVSLDLAAHNTLPGNTLFNVYLIQDSVIGFQSNGGASYVHNGLLRTVLTGNSWGMLLPDHFGNGEIQNWTTSFQLADAIYSDFWTASNLADADYKAEDVTIPTDPEHMRIVAYVASYDPQNIKNNVVYNCIEVPLINGQHVQNGMPDPEALEEIHAEEVVTHHGLCDLSGRRLNAHGTLSQGFYIMNGKKMLICK